ncbi:MAG: glycosyltransferase [Bryobacteraceae bacterium]
MTAFLYAITFVAAGYQLFAIAACMLRPRPKRTRKTMPPVSILKPVRGLDPKFREAIRSHTQLDGAYEVLCGVADANDPALEVLREFPSVRVVASHTKAPNGKVGVLIDVAREAKNPLLIVNDSDIRVDPDYLARVTEPLEDPKVGMVTCLYRPIGDTFAARFEGLGVSTDFAPSTLVARLVGVDEFAMGSTLAFRRVDLDRIGGFESIADYIADDYQLGRRIHALGLKCVISDVIVETSMGGDWIDVWRHQVRWARTIRVSKFGGYLGLPVTNATLWAAVAAACGRYDLAAVMLAARLAMALASGWFTMRSADVLKLIWLIPVRDLYGFAVWLTALFGRNVVWRGRVMKLDAEGRIV